jgi:hypothetical protein
LRLDENRSWCSVYQRKTVFRPSNNCIDCFYVHMRTYFIYLIQTVFRPSSMQYLYLFKF